MKSIGPIPRRLRRRADFRSGRVRIDKERIKTFGAEFDPQPFHLDEEAARDTIFGGLAASGWHTAAVPCGYWSRATSNPPAASWAPAPTSPLATARAAWG